MCLTLIAETDAVIASIQNTPRRSCSGCNVIGHLRRKSHEYLGLRTFTNITA